MPAMSIGVHGVKNHSEPFLVHVWPLCWVGDVDVDTCMHLKQIDKGSHDSCRLAAGVAVCHVAAFEQLEQSCQVRLQPTSGATASNRSGGQLSSERHFICACSGSR